MRGPPPKPTILKIAAGNPGKRPLNQNEPKPEAAGGAPPDWLGDEAKQIWFQVAGPMTRSGLATSVDQHTLARYCALLALWIRALRDTDKAGATAYSVKNKGGAVVGHRELPAFAQLRRLGPQLTALEREFGMTPASRTRIRIERDVQVKKDPDSAIETFLAHRRGSGAGA